MRSSALFHILPYSRSLTASVVALAAWENKPAVILDRTIFYPEGGGQPGDQGSINDIQVLTTVSDGSQILHVLDRKVSWPQGERVGLQLDWTHRYAFMQMHTAQHMISGLAYSLFGIGTLSVHQGMDGLTIETDQSDIPPRTIIALEKAVTEAIRQDIPVISREISHQEAERLGMRRSIKVEGDVRIVTIEGVDRMACGGVHVASTGEVRAVRYMGAETVRSHLRMKWITGDAVRETERQARGIVGELSTLLSSPSGDIVSAVSALQASAARSRYQAERALEEAALIQLRALLSTSPHRYDGVPVLTWTLSEDSSMTLKHVAAAIPSCGPLILFATDEEKGKTSWCVALKDTDCNFETIRKEVLTPLGAKGGGRSPIWQGVSPTSAGQLMEAFLEFMTRNETDKRG